MKIAGHTSGVYTHSDKGKINFDLANHNKWDLNYEVFSNQNWIKTVMFVNLSGFRGRNGMEFKGWSDLS